MVMRVFQIFSHPSPPRAPFYGFMERIRDMADEYTLIAPQNFMGPKARFVPLSEVWADVPAHLQAAFRGTPMEFDVVRMRYICADFGLVYADVDVELLRPIEIGPNPMEAGPGLLAGNGNAEDGARCWKTYVERCAHTRRPACLAYSGRPVEAIPADVFNHHHARGQYF